MTKSKNLDDTLHKTFDKSFYKELLYVLGLQEKNIGGKKILKRCPEKKRQSGSLLENTISQLVCLHNTEPHEVNKDEQLSALALQLVMTWTSRILFAKFLEDRLSCCHPKNTSTRLYVFLDSAIIPDYKTLEYLFFNVISTPPRKREAKTQKKFSKVPYLGNTFFTLTETEKTTICMGSLADKKLALYAFTMLKNKKERARKTVMPALDYLFALLKTCTFIGESASCKNKTFISTDILALLFEKINGYRDGAFFTPNFISVYISRKTLRSAVVQKFQELKKYEQIKSLNDIYHVIYNGGKISRVCSKSRKEANAIINSLKICDPAAGAGHFLLSALHELLLIKQELGLLTDEEGLPLQNYVFILKDNDLIITDKKGKLFCSHPHEQESFRVQKTLFREKKTIMENCLFGVDINPHAINISRLRLQMELLKNIDFENKKNESGIDEQCQFFPNLNNNIKQGNALVSNYTIDDHAFLWSREFPQLLDEHDNFIGFDAILGNPPYISYYSRESVGLTKKLEEYFYQNYIFLKGHTKKLRKNSLMFFLETAHRLLKEKGNIAFVCDVNLLEKPFFAIRKFLCENSALKEIITELNIFSSVTSGQIILFLQKGHVGKNQYLLKKRLTDTGCQVDQDTIETDDYVFVPKQDNSILQKMKSQKQNIEDFFCVRTGMNLGGAKEKFLHATNPQNKFFKFIDGGDNVTAWKLVYPSKRQTVNGYLYVDFNKSLEKKIIADNRRQSKKAQPGIGKNNQRFLLPKIILRQSAVKLNAVLDVNGYHCGYSLFIVNSLQNNLQELYGLLALLNSSLYNYYVLATGALNVKRGKIPQIRVADIKKIPYKSFAETDIKIIQELVTTLQSSKTSATICAAQEHIDRLVYRLYKLTDTEIALVEKKNHNGFF